MCIYIYMYIAIHYVPVMPAPRGDERNLLDTI